MKKILLLLVALCFSVGLFSQIPPIDTDGNGYLNISTLEQLRWFAENDSCWSYSFELDNDINASDTKNWNIGDHDHDTTTVDSAMGWKVIGNSWETPFKGNINGHGYCIDSLYLHRYGYTGFVGFLDSGSIVDLNLSNCNVKNTYNAASLLDFNNYGIVKNCHASGVISGSRAAGLIRLNKGYIDNCSFSGSVYGGCVTGGLIGENSGSVNCSYATGSVICFKYYNVGGLIGENSGSVNDSYANCSVSGISCVGGLIGANSGSFSNCYAVGTVMGEKKTGGLIGDNQYNMLVTNSFWDIEVSGLDSSAAGVACTTKEMKDKDMYVKAGWNFISFWNIDENINNGYPYITDRRIARPESIKPIDTDGNGYLNISSLENLLWMSNNYKILDDKFELSNDISAASSFYWDDMLGFTPILSFDAIFEGNGYTIDSLYINGLGVEADYVGLFGTIKATDKVQNLNLTNCFVIGNMNIGGIAGQNLGEINHCQYTGYLYGTYFVGGIAGNNEGDIVNSTFIGFISANHATGGIAGNNEGKIENSNSAGEIYSEHQVGGLVGINQHHINACNSQCEVFGSTQVGGLVGAMNQSVMLNSFATGTVAGQEKIGGLVGYSTGNIFNCYSEASVHASVADCGGFIGANNGNICNSYANGKITGTGINFGGFVGNNANGTVLYSFWDIQTSGMDSSAGGLGKTSQELKERGLFINSGWNFNFIWKTDNSYPYIAIDSSYRPIDLNNDGFRDIRTMSDLRWLSESGYDIDINYRLENNIDAYMTKQWNGKAGWYPICNLNGIFDGNGYTIENLFINRPEQDNIGLCGNCPGDSLQLLHLHLKNCNIIGKANTGSFYGTGHRIVSIGCDASGSVKGTSNVGGFCGQNNNGRAVDCSSQCKIEAVEFAGGFAGQNAGSINTCFYSGSIKAQDNYVGGLVAQNTGEINNSFALGNIKGCGYMGGLVAVNYSGDIVKCYSSVAIESEAFFIGGFVGDNNGDVIQSFWNHNIANIDVSDGGKRLTTDQMKSKSTYTAAGWDFTDIWDIDGLSNAGYPFFRNSVSSIEREFFIHENDLLYPNPARDILYIDIVGNPEIKIYDLAGTQVLSATGNQVNIETLVRGMYYVLILQNGELQRQFFVKE